MYKYKLSVITINYNNGEGLKRTIESVVNQTNKDFEFIIIDGGSTDGSVEIIKEYVDEIDYWVSEKDRGIYHAMNKGVAVANGEYCIFMNSGDMFYDNEVIKKVYDIADEEYILDISKTEKELDWHPQYNDEDMLKEAYRMYKDTQKR